MPSDKQLNGWERRYSYYALVIGLLLAIAFLLYKAVKVDEVAPEDEGSRYIPAKNLPVPATVSPEMQSVISRPLNPLVYYIPQTTAQWHSIVGRINTMVKDTVLPRLMQFFPAETKPQVIGGVNAYMIVPESLSNENKDLLLIGIHGGGYMLFGGEASLPECLAMAHYGKYKVVAIDYRMPPDHPFPAALDDVIAVYREIIKEYDPKKIGMFGTSAGGGLLLAAVLKMQELGLPTPAVLSVGTPWSDLTETGDSYFTNEYIDNVVITYNGMMKGMVQQYVGTNDIKDPLISPVYGTYTKEFPPSIFTTGTRDLFLSNTVRVFRKLRQAGAIAELQVFEGMSHAFYVEVYDAPESREAFDEMKKFVDRHLHP